LMITIPCMWFGIITNVSRPAFAEWFGISFQYLKATLPIFDNCMRPSTSLPKRHSRPRVQTVTKYQPFAVLSHPFNLVESTPYLFR
jgi:hypothetical protein